MNKLMHLPALVILVAQLALAQSPLKPSDVAGVWEGTLHSFGQDSRLIYKISFNDDGSLSASHDAPDFSLNDIPITEVKLEGNRLVMKMAFSGLLFEGTVEKDILRGRHGTPALWIPLTLRRRSRDPHFLLENMVPRLGRGGERILGYRYTPPEEGDDGWEVADATTEGVDTSKIGIVMRHILAGGFPNLHSVVVVKDGNLILDEYFYGFHRDRPHRISSIAKIVPAACIGLAIERGLIKNMEMPLCELFPEYSDLLCTDEKRMITLNHLLTMTTGLRWDESSVSYFDSLNDVTVMKRSPEPVRSLFERPLAYRPGERFVYNSGCVIAMEALIQKVTKAHYLLIAQNGLFTPMGISNYRWDYSEGLHMLPRDMAKIGQLFLKRGEFNGIGILPAGWADSATQRFERQYPRYFNHWEPIVFFVDGTPIRALRAGGWGGQSITIFPSMNTVVVYTGANQLQPADYDVSLRDYLLPAILTPQYRARHPDVRYNGIHRTRELEWESHVNTEMACLKACAQSFGLTLSDAQLYGATGVGFLINIDERAEPKSIGVWNWRGAYELCRNLGFSVESTWMHKSSKEFPATQKRVWDRVREAIDSGYACYGFDLHNGTRSLIIGYDSIGYYDMGTDAEKGKGPTYWYELGQTSIGLLGMHFVRPVSSEAPFREVVKKAFQFVLDFSTNSPKWVPVDCKAGPDGYARWISLIESGREDGSGLSINAAVYAEGRRFALEFLEGVKTRLGPEVEPLFEEAIKFYRRVANETEMLSQLFPHTVSAAQRAANLRDPDRRRAATQHLRAAKESEVEGLKALADIIKKL